MMSSSYCKFSHQGSKRELRNAHQCWRGTNHGSSPRLEKDIAPHSMPKLFEQILKSPTSRHDSLQSYQGSTIRIACLCGASKMPPWAIKSSDSLSDRASGNKEFNTLFFSGADDGRTKGVSHLTFFFFSSPLRVTHAQY